MWVWAVCLFAVHVEYLWHVWCGVGVVSWCVGVVWCGVGVCVVCMCVVCGVCV